MFFVFTFFKIVGHRHDAYIPSHHLSSPEVQSSRRLEVTGNDSFAGDRASYQETSSNLSKIHIYIMQ